MRRVLFWACLPFVMLQAIRLRRTAPRFSAASGALTGRVAGADPVALVGIGDSIIAGVGASTLELALIGQTATALSEALGRGVSWEAIGSIGATSLKVRTQLIQKLAAKPADCIVVSAGVNDLTSLSTLGQWRISLDLLLRTLHEHSPDAVIAVAGIPPLHGFPLLPQPLRAVFGMRGMSFDQEARRVVEKHPYAVYVPISFTPSPERFARDGFHPSESSYVEFGRAVATAFAERIRKQPGQPLRVPQTRALALDNQLRSPAAV